MTAINLPGFFHKPAEVVVDLKRIYHTWDKWECYPAGFYAIRPPKGMNIEQSKRGYAEFLADLPRFGRALQRVLKEWPNSCEHYLSNTNMNRLAWLGQASMCIETGVSKYFCGGYFLLDEEKRKQADWTALAALQQWLRANGYEVTCRADSESKTQMDLY